MTQPDITVGKRERKWHDGKISGMSEKKSTKLELRSVLKAERAAFKQSESVVAGFASQVTNLINSLECRCIAGYLPYGNEPNLEPVFQELISRGIKVLMPISQPDHSLNWVSWHGQHRLNGIFNFHEAHGDEAELAEAELMLLPALAADARGARLGKGKGYYDRALESFAGKTAAVVFDHELLDEVPIESHDKSVDFIVTQSRLLVAG